MADIQSNIDINIDTSDAISSIKNLQRQISVFHQSLRSSGSAVNAALSEDLTRNLVNSVNATKKFSASIANVHSTTESFTTALEKNKLSMGQYFKYAMGASGSFSKQFKKEFDTINQVAESRVRTLQTQFIKLGRDANGMTKAIKIRPLALDMQNYATQTAIALQKQQLFNQLVRQGSTNLLNFGKNTQWAGRQLMVGFTVPLTMLGSVASKTFMEMEKQIIRLKRVYGDFNTTTADTEKMVSQIRQLGNEFTKYGVAVSKTMELAADAAAMGKTGADLVAQVREANRLAVLGGVEQAQALETTTSVTNAFGIAAEDLAGKINFLNAVENQSVTSIEDLTIAIPKAAPVIKQLGGNVEDLAFFLTAMKEGGINASEGANALKSGIASIINPTAKASEFMAGLGVNIKGIVESNKGNVKGMIMGIAEALNQLDPLNRARAIEQMFGKFQFARISTLFQNITKEGSQAQTVLGLSKATAEELAILSEREMKKISDSPMYKFQKAIEDVKTSLVPLGEQFLKMITPVIEFVKGALENFNKLDGGVKNFIMGTIAVLGALAPAAIMAFGLVANGVANLIKGGNLLRNVFTSIGRGTGILGTQTQYMSSEQLEAAAAASSLNHVHQGLTQQFTAETAALRRLISAYNDTIAAQQRLAAAGAIGRATTGGRGGKKFARGGVISGPGTGTSDSIAAMVSNGEAIIPAKSVARHPDVVKGLIAGNLPGFAQGFININGSNVPVGGSSGLSAEKVKKVQLAIDSLVLNLDNGAEIATMALERLGENFKGSLKDLYRDIEVVAQQKFGLPNQKAADAAGQSEGQRENSRSASGAGVKGTVKENLIAERGEAGKVEFERAQKRAEASHQSILETLIEENEKLVNAERKTREQLEEKARQITGYDPKNPEKYHGLERGHATEVSGLEKRFPEAWHSSMWLADTRVENNLATSLSQDGKPTRNFLAMQDGAQKAVREGLVTEADTNNVMKKLLENKALNEQELKVQKTILQTVLQDATLLEKTSASFARSAKAVVAGIQATQNLPAVPGVRTRDASQIVAQTTTLRARTKLAKGVVSVPGPRGAGDVVPAMLTPGESVIPAEMSKKYAPLIAGMVDGTIPGYAKGKKGFNFSSPDDIFSAPPSIPGVQNPGAYVPPKTGFSMGSLVDAGKGIAKGFAANIVPAGKKMAVSLGDKLNDSKLAAQLGSKIFGNDITTTSGTTFRDGIEVRKDKNGNDYYVKPGEGRISKDAAMENAVSKKELREQKRELNRQKSGRIAQAGMGLSMAVGAASALPGSIGQAAQKAVGPISAATAAMSLIPGPWGIAAGVIAGAGAAIWQAKEEFEAFRKEAGKTAKTMSSGTESMKSLSEFAGTVSPSEAMNKIRANESSPYNIKTGKETFGGSYLQSEQGGAMVAAVRKTKILSGEDVAISDIATQLSQAVATSVLTKEQAASIAYNLGAELKDYDFSANVLGKMTEILGPNGEDLTKEPIVVAARIIQEKQDSLGSVGDTGSVKDLIGTGTMFGGSARLGNATQVAAAEQKYMQGFQDILDMGQQNIDNLELAHRKRVDALTAAGDLAALDKENNKYISDRIQLQKDAGAAIKVEYDYISDLEDSDDQSLVASARQIVDNMEEAKKALFSDMDESIKNAANETIEKIANESQLSYATRTTLQASITVDNIDDYQKLQAMFPVDSNTQTWDKIAQVAIKYGSGSQNQLIKLGGFFGTTDAEKKSYDLFVNYVYDSEDGQQIMDDLTEVTRVSRSLTGTPIKMSELIDTTTGKPTAKLNEIRNGIKKVSDAITKNKGKAIKYSFETVGFKLTKAEADYFNSLPADQQKVYTTTYLTVQKTVTQDQINAFRKSKIAASGSNGTLSNYWSTTSDENIINAMSSGAGEQATQALTTEDVKTPETPSDTTGGGGSNPLDDLLKRLKNIRAAAVNATGGIKELMKWMTSGALEKKGGGLLFNGIDQQLGKKGLNKDFISFITDADKATQAKYITIKNGIVTLKKEGVALQNLFNALTLGEYERSVAAAVASSRQELAARKDLLEAGMSYKDAVEAGRDSGLAEAIAAIKASTNIKNKNKAIAETIALYKQQKAATEAAKTNEEKFNELSDKVSKKFDAEKQKINLEFEVNIAGEKNAVTKAQQEIEGIRFKMDDLNAGITAIGWAEEDINKKYDARKEALDKVKELNDKIAASQKDQLSLASALSSGDMAAAAKAAQDMRANAASQGLDDMSKELDLARQQELDGLTANVNGKKMTRKDIEKEIKNLEKEIFNIEESRLEPAQEAIRKAEALRDTKLKAIDDEKIKWDQLKNKIDLANTSATSYVDSLKLANSLAAGAVNDASFKPTGTTNYNVTAPKATGATAPKATGPTKPKATGPTKPATGPTKPATPQVGDKKYVGSQLLTYSLVPGTGRYNGSQFVPAKYVWKSGGGMIPKYFGKGGEPRGTDTVPAMLTPGEFVIRRSSVAKYGTGLMDSINNGQLTMPEYSSTSPDTGLAVSNATANYSNVDNSSVYNSYTINVTGGNNANANDVARLVIGKIKSIDNQRVKGNRIR